MTTPTMTATPSSVATSSSTHHHVPRKSGHLYKKSGIKGLSRKWKTRYFVLEGSMLYYYKREGDTVPKGIVVLTGCKITGTRSRNYFSFRISHPKTSKVYDLAATLQGRMDDWVDILREAALPAAAGVNRMESMSMFEAPSSAHFSLDDADMDAIAVDDVELPADHSEQLETLMADFYSQTRENAEGWKFHTEQRDCKVFVRAASRLGSCKSVGFINHHPYLIVKLLLELSRRQEFDPQLMGTKRVHVYDDHTFVDHLIYKPVFPASARDFVHITHWRVLKDGSIVLIATSVDRPNLCPLKDNMVRATTVLGGFLITPNADYTGADAQYIVKADVRGGIPASLQTKMFVKQAFVLDGLRTALDEQDTVDAESLPQVTNRTLFGLTTTEMDMEQEELMTSTSLANSTEDEDGDDVSYSQGHVTEVPPEGLPVVPEKYREMIDKAIARMDADMDDDGAWNFHSEKHGVKAYTKVDGSLTAAKGVGRVEYNPRAIWDVVIDVEGKKAYDPQLAEGARLAVLDAQTNVDYVEYKPVFVVAGRDFVNLAHWRVLPGGTILVVVQSIEDHALCPLKEPKVVRGEVHIAGWRIVPDADYRAAHVTYMVKTDLKGSVPSRIASKAASEQPYLIHQIAQVLKKSKKLDDIDSQGKLTNTLFELPKPSRTMAPVLTSSRLIDHSARKDLAHASKEKSSRSAVTTIPVEGLPTVPEKYRESINRAIAGMDADMEDETAWNFHSEKHGVKAYTKIDGALTAAKGVGRIECHPRAIWDVVIDVEGKKAYDTQLANSTRLAVLDAQTTVDYVEFKPIFVVSGRDFVSVTHWRVLPGGTILVVSHGVEEPKLCPLKEPKVVRGHVHIAAWKIVPDADYRGAHVTYMVKSDLKGSVPSRVAAKAASEQPYLIDRIAQVLKKSKKVDAIARQGKLTNTVFDATKATQMQSTTVHSVKAVSKTSPRTEPESESKTTSSVSKKIATNDVLDTTQSGESIQDYLKMNAIQFVGALVALKLVSLPGILHSGVVLFLMVYFATMLYMGPSNMTPRRKLMIATFGPPDSGMILGTLQMDVSKTQKYIEEKRKATGEHITITHIVLRALGEALSKAPSVNGHIVFGNYYPAPTVDISCLVAVSGGKDLGVCRLPSVDKMTLKEVCSRVRGDAGKLRKGNDKAQEDRNKLMTMLPTFVIRPIVNLVGWLGGCLGLRIPPVGVEPYMFGSCMVTSVGMMGMELAFAPLSPYAQTPMLVTIGAIKDTPVVEDGKVVIRPILTLTTTIDHRYVDGSQAARMGVTMKSCVEDPSNLESVHAS